MQVANLNEPVSGAWHMSVWTPFANRSVGSRFANGSHNQGGKNRPDRRPESVPRHENVATVALLLSSGPLTISHLDKGEAACGCQNVGLPGTTLKSNVKPQL